MTLEDNWQYAISGLETRLTAVEKALADWQLRLTDVRLEAAKQTSQIESIVASCVRLESTLREMREESSIHRDKDRVGIDEKLAAMDMRLATVERQQWKAAGYIAGACVVIGAIWKILEHYL